MTSRRWLHAALAGASFSFAVAVATAGPLVVADEACTRYAVDIASFATCEDGKVVRPDAAADGGAAPVARGEGNALQVVADEACARFAVDIASFATCEGGRVVRPAADGMTDIPILPALAKGIPANPFAPDARHREAWLLVAAAPAGGTRGCDDGVPVAPVTIAQRR
ncbi:MAG: hypothetical protein U1F58_20125 [Burkholderiales bacterium]